MIKKIDPKYSIYFKNPKYLFAVIAVLIGLSAVYFPNILSLRNNSSEPAKEQITANIAGASEIHSDCEAKPQPSEKFDCYGNKLESNMRATSGRKTLELLQSLNDLGGYANTNCHPLAHKVGNIALSVYGSVPKAAPEYIPTCYSGYYHGLLEQYLATAPSYEKGIAEVCGKPEDQVYFNWFQCTHGEGHGIMQFRNNELPESLKDCDLLDPANQAREICYAGAFMENITTDEKTGHPAKWLKKDDPVYPCNAKEIDEKYRSACYFLASSQILKVNGYNMQDAFVRCGTVEDKYRYLCFQSLGRDVSGSTLRNKEKVVEMCQYAKKEQDAADCFFGAVRDATNEKGEFDNSLALCAVVPEKYKQKCYEGIVLDLGLYRRGPDFVDVCAKMPDLYRSQCQARVVT